MKPLRVLSYNIHKGMSPVGLSFILHEIKKSIRHVHADLVLLQEVTGHANSRAEMNSQFEFLADEVWPHFAYGKNAIYGEGHHGNALLSKYPISYWENQDVSLNRLEKRGLLHVVLDIPDVHVPLHVVCVHLSLFERDRAKQIERLCKRISSLVPKEAPLIVGGDFNDWRESTSHELKSRQGLEEAFLFKHGAHARTFPSWLPWLRLDRLYFRGLSCHSAHLVSDQMWKGLSDHLPLIAEFGIPTKKN